MRCISTTTTARAPKRKRAKLPPHPPFDITQYMKSKPETNILGLNKPIHRLAPPDDVKAALARAQSTGGTLLDTLKTSRRQVKKAKEDKAAKIAKKTNNWIKSIIDDSEETTWKHVEGWGIDSEWFLIYLLDFTS